MTKKQAKEIARRWIGGAAFSFFPDIEDGDESELEKITAACHEIGNKLLGESEYVSNLPDIINDVMGRSEPKFQPTHHKSRYS